jgi:hypothetical protein
MPTYSEILEPGASEPREGSMTFQISQRGREYLKAVRTLLRAAQTMTDRAIARQLKALADDCQRRVEVSWTDRRSCPLVQNGPAPNRSGCTTS